MRGAFFALLAALAGAACAGDVDTVTGPTVLTTSTQLFSGTIAANDVRFYSFTVTQGGSVTVTLASVTSPASGVALTTPLGIGFGIPQGTGCAVRARVTAAPALVAQLVSSATPGIYCVEVADVGQVSGAVHFAARFTHP